jgi:hypothetical protein
MKIKVKAKYFAKVKSVQFNKRPEENRALEFGRSHYRERTSLNYYRPMTSLNKMFNFTIRMF